MALIKIPMAIPIDNPLVNIKHHSAKSIMSPPNANAEYMLLDTREYPKHIACNIRVNTYQTIG
jgi:hypothetical protein